jgi:hypothetical protein
MGRWSYSSRNTVEECRTIDIFWLKRHGYLYGYVSGVIEWNSVLSGKSSVGVVVSIDRQYKWKSYLRLTYSITSDRADDKTDFDYTIPLVSTPCNYGGIRYWFICPLEANGRPCNRRVAKLFLPPGGRYFGCRHCYNLTYKCQKEHNKKVDFLLKNPALLDRMCDHVELLDIKSLMRLTKAAMKMEEKYRKLLGP